jgi:hypothetical protein
VAVLAVEGWQSASLDGLEEQRETERNRRYPDEPRESTVPAPQPPFPPCSSAQPVLVVPPAPSVAHEAPGMAAQQAGKHADPKPLPADRRPPAERQGPDRLAEHGHRHSRHRACLSCLLRGRQWALTGAEQGQGRTDPPAQAFRDLEPRPPPTAVVQMEASNGDRPLSGPRVSLRVPSPWW